jgi:hypothetical protein
VAEVVIKAALQAVDVDTLCQRACHTILVDSVVRQIRRNAQVVDLGAPKVVVLGDTALLSSLPVTPKPTWGAVSDHWPAADTLAVTLGLTERPSATSELATVLIFARGGAGYGGILTVDLEKREAGWAITRKVLAEP